MPKYKVSCEATQECDIIESEKAMGAIAQYLVGYQTVYASGEPASDGVLYSTVHAALIDEFGNEGKDIAAMKLIFADGKGGVLV